MSVPMKNDNETEVCNLDISFDLSDIFDKSAIIKHQSCVGNASEDVENDVQIEQSNENVHDHEAFEVSLNISFDCTDLEPISTTKKEYFLATKTSSLSEGISIFS